ncbi:Rieske 2Fe-2S domain-containing protein [Synechococcus sp. CS-1324]|uniref:aromatic ring-hydroxylating oxygenase subunit alpha n=1 Tax=Synechococcus sp. CS-1324 TaxID=2847980 RepID=UPI00223AC584|nr:SRPBCC family protein [Synechococcus sp. CS-1324]MCT0229719.1 Rieske 2Fe-2S domain-containing protein [Synechococcus sp. CS-1324]
MRDPEAFANEQAALGQTWTLLGLSTDIPNDNDWIRCSLGGVSVFVQRFGVSIKGFENVCQHRFHPIRTSPRGSGLIRCAFHHWVYNQKGEAVGIPQCRNLFGVSPKELGAKLRKVEIATCGVLIFGRFPAQAPAKSAPASAADRSGPGLNESLEEFLGEAWPILKAMCRHGIKPTLFTKEVRANWKLLYEISLEDYHTFAVHPNSLGKNGYLDLDEVHYTRFGPHSGFFHNGKPGDLSAISKSCRSENYHPEGYKVLQIFPNLEIAHHQITDSIWYVFILHYIPKAYDCTILWSCYFQAPLKRVQASRRGLMFRKLTNLFLPFFVGTHLKRINQEDHVICEAMQTTAGSVTEAPLLGLEEQRIGWFREAYRDALARSNRPKNSKDDQG